MPYGAVPTPVLRFRCKTFTQDSNLPNWNRIATAKCVCRWQKITLPCDILWVLRELKALPSMNYRARGIEVGHILSCKQPLVVGAVLRRSSAKEASFIARASRAPAPEPDPPFPSPKFGGPCAGAEDAASIESPGDDGDAETGLDSRPRRRPRLQPARGWALTLFRPARSRSVFNGSKAADLALPRMKLLCQPLARWC